MSAVDNQQESSPFHRGEKELQERTGVRERMETFGRRVIRSAMPAQHREFYAQLPLLIVGHADQDGRPWCSMLAAQPGFVSSPNERQLDIDGGFLPGDPIVENLAAGRQYGLLGIEFHSRRRNRLNGRVLSNADGAMSLGVDQSFGNCPQYIQTRMFSPADPAAVSGVVETFEHFPDSISELISNADTFFVSSRAPVERDERVEGIDASHRGGRPGFVRIDDERTLTVPDYVGNFHFNTLGNFVLDPRAGLLFIDFDSGDVVMLTGQVEIIWDKSEAETFQGAERLWRFTLTEGHVLRGASPLRWAFGEYSPNSLMTGTWAEADELRAANEARHSWRDYRVARIVAESSVIRSLYLEPADGGALPEFEPGQFLTVRLQTADAGEQIRTYTVSSAPGDPLYRISVKRDSGAGSNHLHDSVKVGDTIEAIAPQGVFTLDATKTRPAVLISGGVGITPMMSMLRHALKEGIRTRHLREITFLHAARTSAERAFFEEAHVLESSANGAVRVLWALSKPAVVDSQGDDYHHAGRIDAGFLKTVLALDDYDFYLCGPPGFMQAIYDALRELGVRDARINAEAFGPASMTRRPDADAVAKPSVPEADEAIVSFSESEFEMPWTPTDGTLLELAEAHGLAPAFGCRNGVCGTCAVELQEGEVTYRSETRADCCDDKVLICCAVPAAGEQTPATVKLAL